MHDATAPPIEPVQAACEALRQERDCLRREVGHMLEVLTVWRAEHDRLREEVARLRQAQRQIDTGCTMTPAPDVR